MFKPTLYVLIGVPASGKSSWASVQNVVTVSRDEIRFNTLMKYGLELIKENYFAKEKEAFKQFGKNLSSYLSNGIDIIADATHMDSKSRKKTIDEIDKYFTDYEIVYVVFKTPIDFCIERDSHRTGMRQVGKEAIENLSKRFEEPSKKEDKRIKSIWTITTEVN